LPNKSRSKWYVPGAYTIYVLIGTTALFAVTTVYLTGQLRSSDKRWATAVNSAYNQTSIPGRSCGILSPRKAKTFIGSGLTQQATVIPSYILASRKSISPIHSDGCRYVSNNNSNIYVELNIKNYSSKAMAKQSFYEDMPVGGDVSWLNEAGYGDKLFYDSGVHYLLKDKEIITVAASKGEPGNTKTFSKRLLDELHKDLFR
jgi:hypothetical protein